MKADANQKPSALWFLIALAVFIAVGTAPLFIFGAGDEWGFPGQVFNGFLLTVGYFLAFGFCEKVFRF